MSPALGSCQCTPIYDLSFQKDKSESRNVVRCDWLHFSWLVQVAACINASFLFLAKQYSIYGYTTFYSICKLDIWVISTLWLLGIIL